MATDVHPGPGEPPLPVPATTDGPPRPFTARTGVDPVTGRSVMFLRVVQTDDGSPAAAPRIRLSAGGGTPVEVRATPTTVRTSTGTAVAVATLTAEPDGVQLVEVEILRSRGGWTLQIANTDGRDHGYVWTVANSEPGTRHPWIDVPVGRVRAHAGEPPVTVTLPLANHGPGPLTVSTPDGTDLGSGAVLVSVVPRTVGPNGRATATVAVTPPPAGPVALSVRYPLACDDPLAGTTEGHTTTLALDVDVLPRPLWASGDVLVALKGQDGVTIARVDLAAGTTVPVLTHDTVFDMGVDPATGELVVLAYDPLLFRFDRITGEATVRRPQRYKVARRMAVDRDGTVLVIQAALAGLQRVRPSGAEEVLPTGLSSPAGIAMEGDGTVLLTGGFVVAGEPTLRRVRLADGAASTVVPADALQPPGSESSPTRGVFTVAVEPGGTILLVYSGGLRRLLYRVDPGTGAATRIAGYEGFDEITAMAVTPDGTILVAMGGKGISVVDPVPGRFTPVVPGDVVAMTVVPPLGGLA